MYIRSSTRLCEVCISNVVINYWKQFSVLSCVFMILVVFDSCVFPASSVKFSSDSVFLSCHARSHQGLVLFSSAVSYILISFSPLNLFVFSSALRGTFIPECGMNVLYTCLAFLSLFVPPSVHPVFKFLCHYSFLFYLFIFFNLQS